MKLLLIQFVFALAITTTAAAAANVYTALESFALDLQVKYHIDCHPEDNPDLVRAFYRDKSVHFSFVIEGVMDTYWNFKRNMSSSKAYNQTKLALTEIYNSGLDCD